MYSTHHIVCLIDAQQEDELREEERRHQVPVNSVKVGAELTKEAQQDQGDEEEEEGDRDGGVGDDLQGEDVSVLWKNRPDKMLNNDLVQKKKKKEVSGSLISFCSGYFTSLLEMSISTAKLVMWLH